MASISPTVYVLDKRKSNWSAEHEKGISTTYPFDLQPSGADDYVTRTYLQFLWLPNSLTPLSYLVPSLKRVESPPASLSTLSHPMHALLDPLLLSTRSVTNKYRSELLQILENGGGAGEMEEAMMWYAIEHEKPDDFDGVSAGPNSQKHVEDGQWTDEKWRARYLERMERREVQIQILLYMFKLSLPQHCSPPALVHDHSLMTRKWKRTSESEPALNVEEYLEAFMDKLSMWQLVGRIDDHDPLPTKKMDRKIKDERDWTQIFVEDVVEPCFKAQLPELCKLLRSKVFPTSPFSEAESDATPTYNVSPVAPHSSTTTYLPTSLLLKESLSRTPSISFSRAPSPSPIILSPRPTTASFSSRNLIRSRSSSLSLSLAQEQEERAAAAAEQQSRKRGRFHREVSMTRVFKNKGKGRTGAVDKRSAGGTVKIEALKVEKSREDQGVTLVDETPVKPRNSSTLEKNALIKPLNFAIAESGAKQDNIFTQPMFTEKGDQEEEWMMDSLAAVVVFDPLLERQDKARPNYDNSSSEEEWDKNGNQGREGSGVQVTQTRKPSRGKSRKK